MCFQYGPLSCLALVALAVNNVLSVSKGSQFMAHVFVSHSRYDKEIVYFFRQTIKNHGFQPVLVELENLHSEFAGPLIRDKITNRNCIGLAVLLGDRVLFSKGLNPQYIHSWIGFEVGIAASARKPIMVFEDYDDDVKFPIPYLDHYVRYIQNDEHSDYIGSILGHIMPTQRLRAPDNIRCPHPNCNAGYSYWSVRTKVMHCPACRQIFTFDGDSILKWGNKIDIIPSNIR